VGDGDAYSLAHLPTCSLAPHPPQEGEEPAQLPHTPAGDPQPLACHPVGFLEIWGVWLWGEGGHWGGTKTCTVWGGC